MSNEQIEITVYPTVWLNLFKIINLPVSLDIFENQNVKDILNEMVIAGLFRKRNNKIYPLKRMPKRFAGYMGFLDQLKMVP